MLEGGPTVWPDALPGRWELALMLKVQTAPVDEPALLHSREWCTWWQGKLRPVPWAYFIVRVCDFIVKLDVGCKTVC